MISKIQTVQQLRLEILRRKTLDDSLKQKIKTDFKELKASLRPLNLIKNAMANKTIGTTAIATTAFSTLLFAARKTILSKSKGMANSALSLILPKIASSIASQTSHTIFSKLSNLIRK